jgi:hypothetical protein
MFTVLFRNNTECPIYDTGRPGPAPSMGCTAPPRRAHAACASLLARPNGHVTNVRLAAPEKQGLRVTVVLQLCLLTSAQLLLYNYAREIEM